MLLYICILTTREIGSPMKEFFANAKSYVTVTWLLIKALASVPFQKEMPPGPGVCHSPE